MNGATVWVVRRGVIIVGLAITVAACTALTGASNLEVCQGAACADAGLLVPGPTGSSGKPVIIADGGHSGTPGNCIDGQSACDVRALSVCVGTQWSTPTPCPETCGNPLTADGKPDDAACIAWPSCRSSAGSSCAGDQSCCATKPVPGGEYNRKNSPDYHATVAPFSLEVYEVTVGRVRAFVDAGGGTQKSPPADGAGANPHIPGSGWQSAWNTLLPNDTNALKSILAGGTWTDTPGGNETKPINNVNWLVAFAFCAWDGARLPTFAEWDFAAAGGDEQRVYPWSQPHDNASISDKNAAYNCNFTQPAYTCPAPSCTVGNTPCDPAAPTDCVNAGGTCVTPPCFGCDANVDIAPVGSRPDGKGRYDHMDLGGNVAELFLDAMPRKDNGRIDSVCDNCAKIMGAQPNGTAQGAADDYQVLSAGGGWSSSETDLLVSSVQNHFWWERSDAVGFRCARDP